MGNAGDELWPQPGPPNRGISLGETWALVWALSEPFEWANPNVDMHNMKEVVHDGQTRTTNYAPQPGPPNRETSLREAWGPTWVPV